MFKKLLISASVATVMFCNSVVAEPWVDTRDPWLRADIEALSAKGVIKTPITTWPLPWASISKDLAEVDENELAEGVAAAYLRVKREAESHQKGEVVNTLSLRAGNQGKLLRNFGDKRRETAEGSFSTAGQSGSVAWNIEATRAVETLDGQDYHLDNSYLATTWGNWIFSAGAQERWYGPGWDSSLILGNNHRPVPTIAIDRNHAEAFETPWLSWIGPWSLSMFAGQLEGDRFIPHAKLLGMSVTFKPFDSLEIGLRRTAQWGGHGRPETLSSLVDLAIGRTNCDQIADGCDDRLNSSEAGNQVAGVDFSWTIPTEANLGTVYGQIIGEDEAGHAPSRKFYQFGYKNSYQIADLSLLTYLEYADTENERSVNMTYNHGIYQTGYRTEGKSIGSTYDNDTESLSLGFIARHRNGHQYKAQLAKVDMNKDGTGKHTISRDAIDFYQFEFEYQLPLESSTLGFDIELKDKMIDTTGYLRERYNVGISWEKRF